MSDSFIQQIREDISFYQEKYPYNTDLAQEPWAFNYWILDKLFCEDESEIENKIVDYHDFGIDCFVWHEDARDLYLIQNKYYSDSSILSADYVETALNDAYGQLYQGTYIRSSELQSIFSKYHTDPDFRVYHFFYVTNNKRSESVSEVVRSFNSSNDYRQAAVFYLDDIETEYYGEPRKKRKNLDIEFFTVNKGTQLNVLNKEYNLNLPIDAMYVMLPITTLYHALELADSTGYPIFEANIRDYLGAGVPVNKRIIKTLKSKEDRKRFFFYNNGITMICRGIIQGKMKNNRRYFTLSNPQIVNGCQTVSSIKSVLDSVPLSDLESEYADVFVMAKILIIPSDSEGMELLRKNIVTYNNSQNSIDEKAFVMAENLFGRIKAEFLKYGFLVQQRQSDKREYLESYKKPTELKARAKTYLERFGLLEKMTRTQDFIVDLSKLLQVVLAFSLGAKEAFQRKSYLLKNDSLEYKKVTEAIRNPDLTMKSLLELYLLYLRAESEKRADKADGKIPVTMYLLEGFSAFECKGAQYSLISGNLSSKEDIDALMKRYSMATSMYLKQYSLENEGKEYNSMIKEKLDLKKLSLLLETVSVAE